VSPAVDRWELDPGALVEAGLATACGQAGAARSLLGFDLYRIPDEHPFLRSLALPRGDPPDWAGPLDELVRVCATLGLSPRLELLAQRRARLRAALAAAGWVRTLAVPVLAEPVRRAARAEGGAWRLDAAAPEDRLAATLAAQHAILGAAPPSAAELACFRACLADGDVRTWVRLDESGRPVAAVSLLGGPPAVELAGLWTRPDRRRRGLARSLARAALAGAAETGAQLVWAGAANAASEALLRGLGMTAIATLESWERPAGR
jgi:ribosomal protein S18 acetylase RimI-like enzyme